MDWINIITNLVSSVGFPICMCIILLKQMRDSEASHKEALSQLSDTVDRNTNAILALSQNLMKNE